MSASRPDHAERTEAAFWSGADDIITSLANPTIRAVRGLHRRRNREREQAALVEGPRAIAAAVESGAPLRLLLLDAARVGQLPRRELAPLIEVAARIVRVAAEPFHAVADTEHPQPILAVVGLPQRALPADCTLIVAADGVRDPGNLGALARSAAAAGADGLALLPGSVDPFSPKTLRASAGVMFRIPTQEFANIGAVVDSSFTTRPCVVLADAAAERDYDAHDWTQPTLLIVGGEAAGASADTRTYADVVVRIPMSADVESLNAAVAGSILLFEAARQRRANLR